MFTTVSTPPTCKNFPPIESTGKYDKAITRTWESTNPANYLPYYNYIFKLNINFNKLDDFLLLENNWNGYGASKFTQPLIDRAKKIISILPIQPKIFPTGRNSVQLEYEKESGDYLEFEIFDAKTNCLQIFSGLEKPQSAINDGRISEIVSQFYA